MGAQIIRTFKTFNNLPTLLALLLIVNPACIAGGNRAVPEDSEHPAPGAVEETPREAEPVGSESPEPESTRSVAGTEGFLWLPANWPAELPTPPEMTVTRITGNPAGGYIVEFTREGTPGELAELYRAGLSEWTETDPPFHQWFSEGSERLSYYRDGETLDVIIYPIRDENEVGASVTHNWRTPPGELPDGWPGYVPLIPGLDVEYGQTGQAGDLSIFLQGYETLEAVADFYLNNLNGWSRINPANMEPIVQGSLTLSFGRGHEHLTITGAEDEGLNQFMLVWMDTSR